jgi:nucleoside-diphosphate-sugar epimerase
VNLLAAESFCGKQIEICNRNQWRPFIHVCDIAQAFCLALESSLPKVSARIFNAGSSRMNHPLSALQEAILDASPQTRVTYGSSADPRDDRVCFERIRSVLGFECEISLREGVREIHQQLRLHPALDYTACLYRNHFPTLRHQRKSAVLVGAA